MERSPVDLERAWRDLRQPSVGSSELRESTPTRVARSTRPNNAAVPYDGDTVGVRPDRYAGQGRLCSAQAGTGPNHTNGAQKIKRSGSSSSLSGLHSGETATGGSRSRRSMKEPRRADSDDGKDGTDAIEATPRARDSARPDRARLEGTVAPRASSLGDINTALDCESVLRRGN
jgi:hypothetical protein